MHVGVRVEKPDRVVDVVVQVTDAGAVGKTEYGKAISIEPNVIKLKPYLQKL